MIGVLGRAVSLLAIGVVPAAAAVVVVDAEFPERLPTPPTGKLAPAFVATVKVNGRFLGITTDDGKAVIETPPSVTPSDAHHLLFDPVSFPSVAAWTGEPFDPISDVVVIYQQGIDVTSVAMVPPVVAGFTVKERYAPGRFVVLDGAGPISSVRLQALDSDPDIRFVEPNYRYRLSTRPPPPDDPEWTSESAGLWGLRTIGVDRAWKRVHDVPESIRVAVVDSGMQLDHPDLALNIWENPLEVMHGDDDVDNDGNGCVDDFNGCDKYDGDGFPDDSSGHGTQVAGIIGAVGNDHSSTVGVAWRIRMIPVRVAQSEWVTATTAAYGIDYARLVQAKIINASWSGSNSASLALSNAIAAADGAGIVLVAAAGNDTQDMDAPGGAKYPAAYGHPNIIAVMGTNQADAKMAATNWGAISVDLGAPAGNNLTTTLQSQTLHGIGTSMAAPHVTGALALTWAVNPSLTAYAVRALLLSKVTPLPALSGLCVTGGRLDVGFLEPVEQKQQEPPPPPTLLEVDPQ